MNTDIYGDFQICISVPLKMMKNTFYFTLKSLFLLKIFKFFCKRDVNFKIYDAQPGKQNIAKYILPDISRIKSNLKTWSVNTRRFK